MSWTLRFVTSTEVSRTTRLDLNDASADPSIELDDYNDAQLDLGEAGIERTLADPEGRDGQVVTSSKRPNREVVIPLCIHGTSAEFAAAMSALSRECDRAKNYLEWCPDGADPVFFVVRQGVISNPEMRNAAANVWTCDLTLMCDPAALGPLETDTVASVSNDPSGGGMQFTMPTILGDIAAPLNIEANWDYPGVVGNGGSAPLLHVHSRDGSTARSSVQAESATAVTDTALQAASAAMSGGGTNDAMRCTFATTATAAIRLTFSSSSAPTVIEDATYKVLLRVRKTVATNTFGISIQTFSTTPAVRGSTVTYGDTDSIGPHWLDLGTMPGDPNGYQIIASRESGAGSLDFDCMLFLPVDVPDMPEPSTSMVWQPDEALTGGSYTVEWLSDVDRVKASRTDAVPTTSVRHPRPAGDVPLVRPGFSNYVTFMRHVGITEDTNGVIAADILGNTTDLTWSYSPRYLFIASP